MTEVDAFDGWSVYRDVVYNMFWFEPLLIGLCPVRVDDSNENSCDAAGNGWKKEGRGREEGGDVVREG